MTPGRQRKAWRRWLRDSRPRKPNLSWTSLGLPELMIKEKFELAGRTALIVGGRGFLGRRFAATLGEFGAIVYSADLSTPSPAAKKDAPGTVSECDNIRQLDIDVADEASVCRTVKQIADERGGIDILVYAATTKPKDFYKPFTDSSLEGWQSVLRVELD